MTNIVKVMTCLPFSGKTTEEIMVNKHYIENKVSHWIRDDYKRTHITAELNYLSMQIDIEFYDNFVAYKTPMLSEDSDGHSVYCLGQGLSSIMPNVDYVIFGEGWEKSRGCLMEMIVAWSYGKRIIALTDDKMLKDFNAFKRAVKELNEIVDKNERKD
jgi:hypothetical protein